VEKWRRQRVLCVGDSQENVFLTSEEARHDCGATTTGASCVLR